MLTHFTATNMSKKQYSTLGLQILFWVLLMGTNTLLRASNSLVGVDYVDLERFMGKWYVIASIPTLLERDIFNAVEAYQLMEDGTISTTFKFRKNGFDGQKKSTALSVLFGIKKPMPFGACSLFGPSRPTIASFIWTQITNIRSSVAKNEILFG